MSAEFHIRYFQTVSWASMLEKILAFAKFYLPLQNCEAHMHKKQFLHLHIAAEDQQ